MATVENGLYRTTIPHPLEAAQIPAGRLVYVGRQGGSPFVVVPHHNEQNRWFWQEPTTPLGDDDWNASLLRLPSEGFYTLPRTLEFDAGGKWLKNAIVQLGYDRTGSGIIFVAERYHNSEDNALFFSDRGHRIEDDLLFELQWAPILPVSESNEGAIVH
ncbi:MAG: hypothetical protein AAGE52_27360 [Myxococcota bacterium]